MADKTKINDALKQLDPKNNDHWTADKKPAMAAVEKLYGDKSITREDVDKAAEGFNRDTAPGFFMSVGSEAAKPWEGNGSQQADGTVETPGVSTDAEGQPQVPGESQLADGSTEPSDGAPATEERSDVSEEIAEASEQAPDANAPGSEAASTAETPRAVEALTDDLEDEEAEAVESVGSAEPWNDYLKSGEDRPVPVDSEEGQAVVQDPRQGEEGKTDPALPDELPGQNAEGEVSGVRKPAVTYDPRNRDAVATAGLEADNVDVNDRPSGVPTPIADGDFSLHPPPLNPESSEQVLPGTSGTSGSRTASEQHESPRASGIGDGETEQSSLGGSSADADEIETLEEELRSREETIADLRVKAEKAGREWRDAEIEADKLRIRIAALQPKNSDTQTVKQYLESQKRIAQKRGETSAALRGAGVDLKALSRAVGKAPIDQAMARKTGRGGKRPTRI